MHIPVERLPAAAVRGTALHLVGRGVGAMGALVARLPAAAGVPSAGSPRTAQ